MTKPSYKEITLPIPKIPYVPVPDFRKEPKEEHIRKMNAFLEALKKGGMGPAEEAKDYVNISGGSVFHSWFGEHETKIIRYDDPLAFMPGDAIGRAFYMHMGEEPANARVELELLTGKFKFAVGRDISFGIERAIAEELQKQGMNGFGKSTLFDFGYIQSICPATPEQVLALYADIQKVDRALKATPKLYLQMKERVAAAIRGG